MKLKTPFSVLILSMFLMALGATGVPQKVKKAFETKYKNVIEISWSENKDGNYVAAFPYYEDYLVATFTASGLWTNTVSDVLIKDIPECAIQYIKGEYENSEVFGAQYYEAPGVRKHLQVIVIQEKGTLFTEDEENEDDWVVSSDDEFEIQYLRLSFGECNFFSSEKLDELN